MKHTSAFGNVRDLILIAITALALGCSSANEASDPIPPPTGTSGGGSAVGGAGGSTTEGGSGGLGGSGAAGGQGGSGGSGGNAGAAGEGGQGGGAPTGRPGMAVVSGGGLCKSPNYTLWYALGESPGGNGELQSSTNFIHSSGVIATTQP